jgi:hypothetical protein
MKDFICQKLFYLDTLTEEEEEFITGYQRRVLLLWGIFWNALQSLFRLLEYVL